MVCFPKFFYIFVFIDLSIHFFEEYPVLGEKYVRKDEAQDYCSRKYRPIWGERRQVRIPSSIRKRLCTASDLQAHYINFGRTFEKG